MNDMNERRLWQAVLLRIVHDATAPVWRNKQAASGVSEDDQSRARTWLTQRGRDYQIVCAFAGIDPDGLKAWTDSHEWAADGTTDGTSPARATGGSVRGARKSGRGRSRGSDSPHQRSATASDVDSGSPVERR